MKTVLVVDNLKKWNLDVPGVEVIDSTDYLVNDKYQGKRLRVFNLCRSYAYQSSGYYVSLLAAARGHKVIPSTSTILDMKSRQLIKIKSDDLDDLLQQKLKDIKSDEFALSIYFGKNLAQKYERLAFELHKQFHAPLIRAKFKRKEKWRISCIQPIGLHEIPETHLEDLQNFAREYFSKRVSTGSAKHARFDLAILVNQEERIPPSDKKALGNFIKAANKNEIAVELIGHNDLNRLAEFDGLFIRETTAVNHITYRFAQKADALGMVVIDDPLSILRCTNKVFLAELFRRYKIPSPKTYLVHKRNIKDILDRLPIPAVLKRPDSAFSVGVIKAEHRDELRSRLQEMLEDSDVIVVQEFMPTAFDWRVGMIDGEPLYLCRYHMARDHWQIYKGEDNGVLSTGESDTLHLDEAPRGLLEVAGKAAGLIGRGLYGLDIKQVGHEFFIIEINDNPSIDADCEDRVLGQLLYERVMNVFLMRMERNAKGVGGGRI